MIQDQVDSDVEVIIVKHGELVQSRSMAFLNSGDELPDPHGAITVAYYFWVIRTGTRTIVVDTGFDSKVAERRGRTVLISVPDALDALGIDPDDAVDLVLTHGHYDHIGNVSWFRNARVHMSQSEYAFWSLPADTSPEHQELVEASELASLDRLRDDGQLILMDRELDLADGVRVLFGPGHTPGELMVRATTSDGVVLLTSDAVHFEEELEHSRPFRVMDDLAATHRTYSYIRHLVASGDVDHVLTGHDNAVSLRHRALVGPLAGLAVSLGRSPQIGGRPSMKEEIA